MHGHQCLSILDAGFMKLLHLATFYVHMCSALLQLVLVFPPIALAFFFFFLDSGFIPVELTLVTRQW